MSNVYLERLKAIALEFQTSDNLIAAHIEALKSLIDEMEELPSYYVVVPEGGGMGGESLGVYEEFEDAIGACDDHVTQQICDHFRHLLPLRVTQDIARRFDLRLFQTMGEIKLPFQKWVDEFYQEQQDYKIDTEQREKAELVRLLAKYGVPE